jgi:hypothetical protein
MRVAILGCGPAGLMAAHAVVRAGHTPHIYSKKVKSKMFGAMYLHRSLPDITSEEADFIMSIMKAGTAGEYAEKVYGDPEAPVSWDKFEAGYSPAWDLSLAYDELWGRYHAMIRDETLDIDYIAQLETEYDIVISSIPATSLCLGGHEFRSQHIWVQHGEDYRPLGPDYIMYYMGDPTVDWYRFSRIGHYSSWEYSRKPEDGVDTDKFVLSWGKKPLETDCDCFPDIMRVGRFGRWEKGILTHHAFEEVEIALQ